MANTPRSLSNRGCTFKNLSIQSCRETIAITKGAYHGRSAIDGWTAEVVTGLPALNRIVAGQVGEGLLRQTGLWQPEQGHKSEEQN